VLVVAALVRIPTLGQPLIEHQTFRQTQTAFTARTFAEDGIDLLHSKLPVLGPPFELPFELPVFQAGAAVLIEAGMPADAAARTAGLVTFLLSAVLVWMLIRHVVSSRAAAIGVLAYVASPLSILYGRASTIDYLAVAATLTCSYAAIRWLDDARIRWLAISVVAGALATMIKLPTFVAWPLLILGYGADRRIPLRGTRLAGLAAIVGSAVAAGVAWTIYTDAIKAATPFGAVFTSRALLGWDLGSIGQRLDGSEWAIVLYVLGVLVIGVGWLPVLALLPGGARRAGRSFTALAAVGVAVLPVLVFFNLYARHDYYEIANAPAWALLLGMAGGYALDRFGGGARVLIAAALVVSIGVTTAFWGVAYQSPTADPYGFLTQAAELELHSAPTELVVIIGDDWLPTVLYYAHRRGLAALYGLEPADIAGEANLYRAASIRSPAEVNLDLLAAWPWVAPVGVQTYRLGETPADLPSDAVRWTGAVGAASGTQLGPRLQIACAGPTATTSVPAGPHGTTIVLSGAAVGPARVWIGSLAPLPATGRINVPPGPVSIGCSGAATIGLDVWALPAWPPLS
jgi:hypothetical protein